MRISLRPAAAVAAAAVGVSLAVAFGATASASASASTAASTPATPATAKVRPCTINDVSFYFGGATAGLGQRSFDVTLLAHDGITCSLSDTPLITLSGPPSQKKPIPLTIEGRGGTLILQPDLPLHATVLYSVPDTPQDTTEVTTLTLAMPDKTSRATDFLSPGTTDIYSGGVFITSWTTGIGLGEGEQAD
jgi:Protein of unknown function (DUF4232)